MRPEHGIRIIGVEFSCAPRLDQKEILNAAAGCKEENVDAWYADK